MTGKKGSLFLQTAASKDEVTNLKCAFFMYRMIQKAQRAQWIMGAFFMESQNSKFSCKDRLPNYFYV